jgi:hypothetical protein
MKYCIVGLLAVLTVGCGGGSDDTEAPAKEKIDVINDCVIENDTLSLANGEKCNLTESSAGGYSITSGEISCDSGVLTYGGSTFTSANAGITFNGLTFMCAAS